MEFLPNEILNSMYFRVKENLEENEEKKFLESKNLKLLKSNENIFKYMAESDLVIQLHLYYYLFTELL